MRPQSFPSRRTGRCRCRSRVMSAMASWIRVSGVQTGPPRRMQSPTLSSSPAPPWRDSAQTTSRSDSVPSTVSPSSETTSAPTPADVSRWTACAIEAPFPIVSTAQPLDWRMFSTFIVDLLPSTSLAVVLPVGHHAGGHGQAVGEVVSGCHLDDVPDRLVGEALSPKSLDVGLLAGQGVLRDLHRVVEHGPFPAGQVGPPVVEGDAVGLHLVVGGLPEGR